MNLPEAQRRTIVIMCVYWKNNLVDVYGSSENFRNVYADEQPD